MGTPGSQCPILALNHPRYCQHPAGKEPRADGRAGPCRAAAPAMEGFPKRGWEGDPGATGATGGSHQCCCLRFEPFLGRAAVSCVVWRGRGARPGCVTRRRALQLPCLGAAVAHSPSVRPQRFFTSVVSPPRYTSVLLWLPRA